LSAAVFEVAAAVVAVVEADLPSRRPTHFCVASISRNKAESFPAQSLTPSSHCTTSQPLKLTPDGGGHSCPAWHCHRRCPPPPRGDDDALAPHRGQWHQQTRRRVERAGGRTAERNGRRIGRISYGFMRDETTNFQYRAMYL
jgi:hypothetical protein